MFRCFSVTCSSNDVSTKNPVLLYSVWSCSVSILSMATSCFASVLLSSYNKTLRILMICWQEFLHAETVHMSNDGFNIVSPSSSVVSFHPPCMPVEMCRNVLDPVLVNHSRWYCKHVLYNNNCNNIRCHDYNIKQTLETTLVFFCNRIICGFFFF